jgi:hypothetical protein
MNDANNAPNEPTPMPSAPTANQIMPANQVLPPGPADQSPEPQVQMDLGVMPGFVLMQFRPAANNIRFSPQGAVQLAIALLQNSIAAAAPPAPLIEPYNPGNIIPAR